MDCLKLINRRHQRVMTYKFLHICQSIMENDTLDTLDSTVLYFDRNIHSLVLIRGLQ